MAISSLAPPKWSPHEALYAEKPRLGTAVRLAIALLFGLIVINDATFYKMGSWPDHLQAFSFNASQPLRLAMCAACGLFGLVHLPKTVRTLTSPAGLLILAFACWVTLTIPFAANLTSAVGGVVSLWCIILFAAALKNIVPPLQIVQTFVWAFLLILFGSWIAYLFFPEYGTEHVELVGSEVAESVRFGGLCSSIALGLYLTHMSGLLFGLGIRKFVHWKWLVPPLIVAAVTILLTRSRTPMMAAFALVIFTAMRAMPPRRFAAFAFILLPLIGLAVAAAISTDLVTVNVDNALSGVSRTGDSQEMYSLTGRTLIWERAWTHITESPWIGTGYGCARFALTYLHAHNALLNLLVETGVIGASLVVLQLVVLLYRLFTVKDLFADSLVVVIVVGGIAERMFFTPIPDSFTIAWFLALFSATASLSARRDRTPTRPEVSWQLN